MLICIFFSLCSSSIQCKAWSFLDLEQSLMERMNTRQLADFQPISLQCYILPLLPDISGAVDDSSKFFLERWKCPLLAFSVFHLVFYSNFFFSLCKISTWTDCSPPLQFSIKLFFIFWGILYIFIPCVQRKPEEKLHEKVSSEKAVWKQKEIQNGYIPEK